MPSPALLLTADTRVRDDGVVIEIRKRGAFSVGIGVICGMLGALLLLADPWIGRWAGFVLVGVGALNLLLGAWRELSSPILIDAAAREVRIGRRIIPFSDIGGVQVVHTPMGNVTGIGVALLVKEQPIRLIDGQLDTHAEALEELAALIRVRTDGPALRSVWGDRRAFTVGYFLALGAIWAGTGWLFAPALYVGAGGWGVHLWPFGLWLLALAPLEVAGIDVLAAARDRPFFAIAWFGSYLSVCGAATG